MLRNSPLGGPEFQRFGPGGLLRTGHLGACMSAVGKLDFLGDFDDQGQLVETPYRPQLAKKLVGESTVIRVNRPEPAKNPAKIKVTQDLARPSAQPPMPGPLSRKPVPADLVLDRSRDILLTSFGKATLSDRYLMPG